MAEWSAPISLHADYPTMSRSVGLHAYVFLPNHLGGNIRTFYRSKLPTSGVEPDLFRCTKPCAWLTHQGASSLMYCKFPPARLSLAPWSHTRGIISGKLDSNQRPLASKASVLTIWTTPWWGGWRDSNPQQPESQSGTLTIWATPNIVDYTGTEHSRTIQNMKANISTIEMTPKHTNNLFINCKSI